MSLEVLPRWQRRVIAWLMNQTMLRKGSGTCPACRHAVTDLRANEALLWDRAIACPHCGHAASLLAFSEEGVKDEGVDEGRLSSPTRPIERSRSSSNRMKIEREDGKITIRCAPGRAGLHLLLAGILKFLGAGIWGLEFLGYGGWMSANLVAHFRSFGIGSVIVVSLAMAATMAVAASMAVVGWRFLRTHKRIEATSEGVNEITTCGARRLEHSWRTGEVRSITVSPAATVNEKLRYRGEIVLVDLVVGFGLNCDRDLLEAGAQQLREVLGGECTR